MSNKTVGVKYALGIMMTALVFTACASAPKTQSSAVLEEGKELAAWKGEWVSADVVKKESALEDAYKEASSTMQYYTTDGFKAAVADSYYTPVIKVKFDGTNTVLLTVKNKEGKEVEVPCEYKYMGKVPMPDRENAFWETFEAVKDSRELRYAKYFIAGAPHAHGGGIKHWHARFSGYSINWLVNGETGFPTYIPASTSQKDMVENFKGSIKGLTKFLPKEPFAPYAEHSRWMNGPLVYDNTSKEVAEVYEKLIKEFAGKNPKGGDFTKEDIIAEMKKGNTSIQDFSHLEFTTEKGKNELVVYQGNKEICRSSYTRVAASASRPYMTMMADNKNAGKFSLISFVVVHGAPNYHFHLWYGANEEELSKLKGTPTCYKVAVSDAIRAEYIENTCRKMLKGLTEK